ncbi:hypothetical protein [Brachyspira sp. G79]|uniref:hypothetical protein n=1 Tax=Brachyspira sp. G79 TaxID=1358104 RepID=UPI001F0AC5B1|nr:hypothetical protein [Brachyspira sp. G79]
MIKKEDFLAKSNKYNNSYNTESIEKHTKNLIRLFEDFNTLYKKYFTEKELELIKISLETHDLGKMNSRFQKKFTKV